jgi:F-type H+-transporting ATPase subunit gamma
MKIVASTKLTRAQKAMGDSRTYGQTSNKVFEEAETKPVEDKKTLLVVCSSDKGLCGGIHSGLSRAVRRMLEKDPNMDIAVIGEKSKAQLSRSNAKNIQLTFAGIGRDVPTFADAQAIADQLVLLPEDYASIKILYNKFVNAQSFEPTEIEAFSEEAFTQSPNFAAFEIDDEVLANLREYSLANSLYWALAEGHAAEQSARRNAMDVSGKVPLMLNVTDRTAERIEERRRHDWQIHHSVQQDSSSCHHRRVGRDHHRCNCFGGYVGEGNRFEQDVYIPHQQEHHSQDCSRQLQHGRLDLTNVSIRHVIRDCFTSGGVCLPLRDYLFCRLVTLRAFVDVP